MDSQIATTNVENVANESASEMKVIHKVKNEDGGSIDSWAEEVDDTPDISTAFRIWASLKQPKQAADEMEKAIHVEDKTETAPTQLEEVDKATLPQSTTGPDIVERTSDDKPKSIEGDDFMGSFSGSDSSSYNSDDDDDDDGVTEEDIHEATTICKSLNITAAHLSTPASFQMRAVQIVEWAKRNNRSNSRTPYIIALRSLVSNPALAIRLAKGLVNTYNMEKSDALKHVRRMILDKMRIWISSRI